MSDKSLQLSEQAIRLTLAVLALGLASWLAARQPAVKAVGPKPGLVMEW